MSRSVHGIELTAAGKALLDHARLTLVQVDAVVEAARRTALPARKTFAIGFQTGHEMNWLSRAVHVLRDELKNIQVTISHGGPGETTGSKTGAGSGRCRNFVAHCRSKVSLRPELQRLAPRLARSADERARERRSIESFRVNLEF